MTDKMTMEQALQKIEELKNYVAREEATNKVGYKILNRWTGETIFESKYDSVKEAVIEANLSEANLSGANLSEAELNRAKFYGKGGTSKLKKNQLNY